MFHKHTTRIVLTVLLVSWSTNAIAQSRSSRAKRQYSLGLTAMKAENYGQAIVHFSAVLKLRPQPEAFYALGLAHERNGDLEQARTKYQQVIRLARKGSQKVRKDVLSRSKKALVRVEQTIGAKARSEKTQRPNTPPPPSNVRAPAPRSLDGTISVQTNADYGEVYLDGVRLGPADGQTYLTLKPGPHELTVRAPGYYDRTVRVVAKAGRHFLVQAPLRAHGGSAGLSTYGITGITVASVGGAALITAIILTTQANSTENDLKFARSTGRLDPASDRAVNDWITQVRGSSYALYAIAGAGAITATTLLLLDEPDVAFNVTPLQNGTLLTLGGRW